MNLLLDQGLPRSTTVCLAKLGIDAIHVSDLGMSAATDRAILEEALRINGIVVSLDSDFHAILAEQFASSPSVIRIRIEGLKADDLAQLLLKVMKAIGNELEAGAVASITEKRIRVRSLPIGKKPR